MSETLHIPVMMAEVVEALQVKPQGLYIDGTFGRGGYTRAILAAGAGTVFAIDRDPAAIAAGQRLSAEFTPRLLVRQGLFGEMDILLQSDLAVGVDGVTLDLGVSSPQLDVGQRGFSFQEDGPLDMRMSAEGPSAADLVMHENEKTLADIIFNYGEERYARRVARKIVAARNDKNITRTTELADLVRQVVPRSGDGIDPATRTFQALRIAVNDELGELQRGLRAAEKLLKPEGRLAIVSFHSLEDRCVKEFLRKRSEGAPRGSRHSPANESCAPSFKLCSRKPILPSDEEVKANPRARSARLRVAERTEAPIFEEYAA